MIFVKLVKITIELSNISIKISSSNQCFNVSHRIVKISTIDVVHIFRFYTTKDTL